MTVHGWTAHASPADLSAEDFLSLRRQAPDYVPPPPAPVSWEQFLAWLDEDTFAEWVDGGIIGPLQKTATFYHLGENGRYRAARLSANGVYTSRVIPGLRVRVSWLRQWPLPKLAAALADLPA